MTVPPRSSRDGSQTSHYDRAGTVRWTTWKQARGRAGTLRLTAWREGGRAMQVWTAFRQPVANRSHRGGWRRRGLELN